MSAPLHYTQKDLTEQQTIALTKYAVAKGRFWKANLRADWETGRDEREPHGAFLRQIRNQFGPEWLNKFKFI